MKWVEVPPSTLRCSGSSSRALFLPGCSSIPPGIPDGCSTTCHPLSITKSPVPRWQSCPQPLPCVCPPPAALPRQPLVSRCVLLYPEPCDTTRLLPCRRPSLSFGSAPCETLPERKRVARSLPPCAPRCPEPGRVRYPPCAVRSSASCKDRGRSRKVSGCCQGSDVRGLTSGYSLPLRGVTECPPQPCGTQWYLRELAGAFPLLHRCTKGYPTQECVTSYSSEQRLAKCPPEPREQRGAPGKGGKESSTHKQAAKGSLPREGAKNKSCSATQHLSRSRCLSPRATHRHSGGVKRSSHAKKSRCAAKWLW